MLGNCALVSAHYLLESQRARGQVLLFKCIISYI